MQYNQPLDQLSNPNAPYVDGAPAAGIQGSIVPAASIEFDQREVVEVITRANVRGYSDFTNTPCAVPANTDMTQLRKAIEGFITNWQFLITTEVTFKVHGSGADFPDLITAFAYLGKYKITPTGHVILQMAGAPSGSASSVQYVYNKQIIISHPNNDRISIFGAPMLAPVSRTDAGYAWNGSSSTQRAADVATNLALLRTKFATELHFSGALASGWFPLSGMLILGTSLMHLDGLLVTSDGTPQGSGIAFLCQGALNNVARSTVGASPFAYDGLACVGFKGQAGAAGFMFDTGGCINCWGEAQDMNLVTPFISIGNYFGISLQDTGFITHFGNCILLNNDYAGFQIFPSSGTQWDGGVFSNANGGSGLSIGWANNGYVNAPYVAGANTAGASHFYRNGNWGLVVQGSNYSINADYGAGANANAGGTIYATSNANVVHGSLAVNYSTGCSPPFNVVGNAESLIS